jgi:hypothetical protein
MIYRLTPFIIASVALIIVSIWFTIKPGPEGWGLLLFFCLFLIGLSGLLIDFIIQRWNARKYKKTFIIETSLLLLIGISFSWRQKSKTLIIPDKLATHYIVTIYGVDNAPKLPFTILNWNYEVRVPDNGILLTSTSFESDFPETIMKTYSGKELNAVNTNLGFIRFGENTITCNGKTYKYRSWMVDSPSCCGYSSKDFEALKIQLEKYNCPQSRAFNLS